jgi:hypothetical protein
MRIMASSSSPQGIVRQRELQATPAWIQLGADFDGKAAYDEFGQAATLSSDGTVLAVGGPVGGTGYVQVFKYASSKWTQLGADIRGAAAGDDFFGWSVSLSSDGTVLAVGAFAADGNGASSGCVRVYKYANSKWTQRGVDINGKAAGDYFGGSVELSSDGTVLAVGASRNDGNGLDSGHVQVYKYANNIWTQMGTDIYGEAAGDESGTSVSLSSNGNVLAVGAWRNEGNGERSGHVRVYTYANDSKWTQLGADIDGESAGDWSGTSVSLSSDGIFLAVGADHNSGSTPDSYSGHVRVFRFANSAWTQMGGDIDGEAAGDNSGTSVSLSSDGTVLAVGADGNDGNGDMSGHVRVYKYANSQWTQLGADIDGEAAENFSGMSVSLSSDGTVLAVGADYNDGTNGPCSGHVRVYKFLTPAPPTAKPTKNPTKKPTNKPTRKPTNKPTTRKLTSKPTPTI